MRCDPNLDAERSDRLLRALGEQLRSAGTRYELVVIGGSALLALGLITRTTQDVDVVALATEAELGTADPLPAALGAARSRVARDFSVPEQWLNSGPSSLLDLGLPAGFTDRLLRRDYGDHLVVWLASRYDQIHFKLYAAVDQGPGKHEADLRGLKPTREELVAAARWSVTHDPSDAYRSELINALASFGVEDVELER